MAKKKRHHKRKKVSGIGAMLNPKSPIMKVGALVVGYFLGDTINPQLDALIPDSLTVATAATATTAAKPATLTPDQADQILMAGSIGLGGLFLLRQKSLGPIGALYVTAVGGVLAGAGLRRAAISFNIVKAPAAAVKGYQRTPVIAGYQRTPVLGKVPAQLQGTVPAQLQGYRVNGPGYAPAGSMGVMGSLYTNADSGSGIQNAGSGYMN